MCAVATGLQGSPAHRSAVRRSKVFKARTLGQSSILRSWNPTVPLVRATGAGGSREKTIAMKRNMVPLLGIAFVVAIISTGIFYGLFAGKLRSSSEMPGHAIVVAARDLDRGTVIQPSDLRVSEVQGVLGGAFSKPEEAAGATLLTSIRASEPLLEDRVSQPASHADGNGGLVPSGMRAVTMHIF